MTGPPSVRAFYFGCTGQAGHFIHDVSLRDRRLNGSEVGLPWDRVDGTLPPQRGPQLEGEAVLHHKDGWTALAFWDRSVDRRGNSNSAFFFEADLAFDEALALARSTFPTIFQRFEFDIVRWVSPQERLGRQVETIEAARAEFLEASVAVWREIDRLVAEEGGQNPVLLPSNALSATAKAAWETYRDVLDRAA